MPFGGWDGRGSTAPDKDINKSYYDERDNNDRDRSDHDSNKAEKPQQAPDSSQGAPRKDRRRAVHDNFSGTQSGKLTGSGTGLVGDNNPEDFGYYDNDDYRTTGKVNNGPSASDMAKGGHFGGWAGGGEEKPTFKDNQSYFRSKYEDSLEKVVDASEAAANNVNSASPFLNMASGMLGSPSVSAGPLNLSASNLVKGGLNKIFQQPVDNLINRDEATTEEREFLTQVSEDIQGAKPKWYEQAAAASSGLLATAVTGSPVAGSMTYQGISAVLNNGAVSETANKYRTPEQIAKREQQRVAKAEARRNNAKNVYADNSRDDSHSPVVAQSDINAPSGESGLAVPGYNYDFNSHLNNFSKG